MAESKKTFKDKVFGMVDVGFVEDGISRTYDIINLLVITINLIVSIALTFDEIRTAYEGVITTIESVTIAFFAVDYLLRLWTSDHLYPKLSKPMAALRYMVSIAGIIDLVSFLPYYLPAFYPSGTAAFRLFRIMRIFKLFRIGAYSDSLSIIKTILYNKRQQLISSMFIIVVLMLASSLCMYSAEHVAQPEVFRNALSGLWWAGSTLLTVGYGDIYPITPAGQLMGTMIAFLGVGVVAIPTGIMSAGFIEQYNEVKEMEAKKHVNQHDPDEQILSVSIAAGDVWSEKAVGEICLPRCMSIEKIMRRDITIPAEHDIEIEAGDILFIRVEK